MALVVNYWDVPGAGSPTTLLSTELNSLASASQVVSSVGGSSGLFTNLQGSGLGGYPLGILQLILGAPGGTLTAGTTVNVWFLMQINGSNPDDGSSSITPGRAADAILVPRASSGAQYLSTGANPVTLPPGTWKVLLSQSTGQTWAAIGNLLTVQPVTNQIG